MGSESKDDLRGMDFMVFLFRKFYFYVNYLLRKIDFIKFLIVAEIN